MPLRKKVQTLNSGILYTIRKCRSAKENYGWEKMASVFQHDDYVIKTSQLFNEKIKNDLARIGL